MPDHNEYASPSATMHDTVGASTLATPRSINLPSHRRTNTPLASPARGKSAIPVRVTPGRSTDTRLHKKNDHNSKNNHNSNRSPIHSQAHSRESSSDTSLPHSLGTDHDLDARLDGYSLDFSKFSSAQFDLDDDRDSGPLSDLRSTREEEILSDVGGPEDFTVNMEKYLFGNGSIGKERRASGGGRGGGKEELDRQQHSSSSKLRPHQPVVEDEGELGEYSEFGPPVDMSTPSHLLRRNGGLTKDGTRLKDIEEGPTDTMGTTTTPSFKLPKQKTTSTNDEKEERDDNLRRQIADLQKAVKDRDGQLEIYRKRAVEAAAAAEQLQAELQRKTAQLDESHAKRNNETLLREQIRVLQKQSGEKESHLQKSSLSGSDINALKKQIGDMQKQIGDMQRQLQNQHDDVRKQLQNQHAHSNLDMERLETIASLRQQLASAQEQLGKRDDVLEETVTKLKEVTAAKEAQLRQKNGEIDDLKAQIADQLLDIERLETDIEQTNTDYRDLENRILSLENKNRPLEEKNISLEAEMTAQQNALKAVAADLPIETGGSTYTEILDLIKDLWQPNSARTPESHPKETETELEQVRQELIKFQTELKEAISARGAADAELARFKEQAAETQSLIKTIEGENSRLTARVDELNSNLDKVQQEYTEALDTIEHFQEEKKKGKAQQQQPSPPPSPPQQKSQDKTTSALEESHKAQLNTLRATHAESTRKLRAQLAAAEKRESALKSELHALRTSAATQETELQNFAEEVKRLQSTIVIKEEAAATVDQHIARCLEKREKEWQRRVDLLLRERDRMGKALMLTWAEKEADENMLKKGGDDEGVYYRYKYVKKNCGKEV